MEGFTGITVTCSLEPHSTLKPASQKAISVGLKSIVHFKNEVSSCHDNLLKMMVLAALQNVLTNAIFIRVAQVSLENDAVQFVSKMCFGSIIQGSLPWKRSYTSILLEFILSRKKNYHKKNFAQSILTKQ